MSVLKKTVYLRNPFSVNRTRGVPFPKLEDEVKHLCKQGTQLQIEDALHLFDKMLEPKRKPRIYLFNILSAAILKTKKPYNYLTLISLYSRMNRADGISLDKFSYGIFIDCCCRMRRTDLGFAVFGTMIKRGRSANTVILNSLMNGFCLERRFDEADELMSRMPELGCTPDDISYSVLFKALCGSGNISLAQDLLQKHKPGVFGDEGRKMRS